MERRPRDLQDLSHDDIEACSEWWSKSRPAWMATKAVNHWLSLNGFETLPGSEPMVAEFVRDVACLRFGHDKPWERQP